MDKKLLYDAKYKQYADPDGDEESILGQWTVEKKKRRAAIKEKMQPK